jgi:hypothetical protein
MATFMLQIPQGPSGNPEELSEVYYGRVCRLFLHEGQKRWGDFDHDLGEASLNQEDQTLSEDQNHQNVRKETKNNQYTIDHRILAGLHDISDEIHCYLSSMFCFSFLLSLPSLNGIFGLFITDLFLKFILPLMFANRSHNFTDSLFITEARLPLPFFG